MSVAPVNRERLKLLSDYVGSLDYSWSTAGDYLRYLETLGTSTNFGLLAGPDHTAGCDGFDDRKPTGAELAHMKSLLRGALDDGGSACRAV